MDELSDRERSILHAYCVFIEHPPAYAIAPRCAWSYREQRTVPMHGDEWTDAGVDALWAFEVALGPMRWIFPADKSHVTDAYPYVDYSKCARVSDDPRCDGGCCDEWAWKPEHER